MPGTKRDVVRVLEYSDRLKIYQRRECLCEYVLPADGVKNQSFSPPGLVQPRRQPNNRKKPAEEEDKRLRAMGEGVVAYLDFALKTKGIQRHRMVRQLYALSSQMTSTLFIQTLQRALRYRIASLQTLRRIALLYISQGDARLPFAQVDENFRQREAYQEGCLTDLPDFTVYERMLEKDDG